MVYHALRALGTSLGTSLSTPSTTPSGKVAKTAVGPCPLHSGRVRCDDGCTSVPFTAGRCGLARTPPNGVVLSAQDESTLWGHPARNEVCSPSPHLNRPTEVQPTEACVD